MRTESRLEHPKDGAAIENERKDLRGVRPKIGWFQLRPFGSLHAGTEVGVRPTGASMLARELDGGERAILKADLITPAAYLAQSVAEQHAADLRRTSEQLAEMGSEVAAELLRRGIDPFDDWH